MKVSAFLSGVALIALTGAPALAAEAQQGAGRMILDVRLRYESFEPEGPSAEALTSRVRLGWQTPKLAGLSGLVEVEGVAALVDDYADGVDPKPGHAVIPDPETFELNRLQLAWEPTDRSELTVGRQRIILGNARFVGNSGWRQNEQTFDAVKAVVRPADGATVTYAYIGRVNRTTGRDHPQGVWKGDVHLVQGDMKLAFGQATAYAYLLDFSTVPAQSSATYGLRLAGTQKFNADLSGAWELEYARQTDWADAPAEFDLDYILASGTLKSAKSSLGLVYESLDGNGRQGFHTPLASLHGFQGWSDVIGATPVNGVRDIYLRGHTTIDAGVPIRLAGELHDFADADGDDKLGSELDLAVSAPLRKSLGVELGVARFETDTALYPDATRAWLTLEYKY